MLSIDIDDINQSIDKLSPKNGGGGDDDEGDATKNTSRYVRFIHAQVHLLVLKIIIGGG